MYPSPMHDPMYLHQVNQTQCEFHFEQSNTVLQALRARNFCMRLMYIAIWRKALGGVTEVGFCSFPLPPLLGQLWESKVRIFIDLYRKTNPPFFRGTCFACHSIPWLNFYHILQFQQSYLFHIQSYTPLEHALFLSQSNL